MPEAPRRSRPSPTLTQRSRPMPERSPVGFGRRARTTRRLVARARRRSRRVPTVSTMRSCRLAPPRATGTRPQGLVRSGCSSSPARSTTPALRSSCAARPAGRVPGLVTLAVPESLQPLFAAKVVEATTMALPEDDVEEIDPEAAMARILDHEHDALVVGPGLRPGLATTELVRLLLPPSGEADAAPDPPRRRGAPLARHDGRVVAGRPPAVRPDPARRRVRPAPRRERPRRPTTTATSSPTTTRGWRPPATRRRPGAASSC